MELDGTLETSVASSGMRGRLIEPLEEAFYHILAEVATRYYGMFGGDGMRSALASYTDYMKRGHPQHALNIARELNLPSYLATHARNVAMKELIDRGLAKKKA